MPGLITPIGSFWRGRVMTRPTEDANRDAYIDLIKRAITNYVYLGGETPQDAFRCVSHYDLEQSRWKIDQLSRPTTLLTKSQLDLIEKAVLAVEAKGVPGDFLEAGIWRGGAIVLMRALLKAYNISGRKVFAADSFAGIPTNTRAINDPVDLWSDRWVASLDEVRQAISRFGLLDDKIKFVVGYFEDSLQSLEGKRFSVVRLDSDSYDSVETSLEYLYPLLSQGGFLIVDDWHLPGCRMAVMDYRSQLGIRDEVHEWDGNAYWVKQQSYDYPMFPRAG
jgi:O-methyltransferase/8-demethyl-8-(2,3-dimethoxy-alpha-L-rhamnosyl)tetracenomycin-C 4'-O-methyltransferase